tara:strand:- start:15779 stop:16972 length:1194 start_codon:yes stop_codon:yes gene_type:complete
VESFYTKEDGEIHYYKLREKSGPDTIYVSKLVEFENSVTGEKKSRREIRKVFGEQESSEVVRVKGEFILRSSPTGRDQIKVIVHENDNNRIGFVLQKFRGDSGNPSKESNFSFYDNEFHELLEFLNLVRFIDLSDTNNFKLSLSTLREKVLVNKEDKELLDSLSHLQGDSRINFLEKMRESSLTKQDLDILTGRKDGLELFRHKLYVEKDWNEIQWQNFFAENTWIFGYGLDYRFLSILQKEAAVSDVDVDGKNTVKSDFLMGSTDFTVLVELKKPDTLLFENSKSSKNRSHSWRLSQYLVHAVSQILAQKAAWEIKSSQTNYDENGHPITQRTSDPKAILIIGRKDEIEGNPRDFEIKQKTFELYRRDSRNVEILTYDELYERAYYIVNQELPANV